MYSQTFVGREIFSAVWGIGILGAASSVPVIQYPFDEQLRQFITLHKKHLIELWRIIEALSCFDGEVMKIGEQDAPWAPGEVAFPDLDHLKMTAFVGTPMSRHWKGHPEMFERISLDISTMRDGVDGWFANFLDGLLKAHWAFCLQERSADVSDFANGLHRAFSNPLLGLRDTPLQRSPEEVTLAAYAHWKLYFVDPVKPTDIDHPFEKFIINFTEYMNTLTHPTRGG